MNIRLFFNFLNIKIFYLLPAFQNTAVTESTFSVRFFLSYLKQSFTDENGEIGVGTQKNRNITWSLGGNTRYIYTGVRRNLLTFFTEVRSESFTPFDEFREPQKGSTNSRVSATFTAEDDVEIITGTWIVNPSLRLDFYRTRVGNPDVFLHLPQGAELASSDTFVSGKIGRTPASVFFAARPSKNPLLMSSTGVRRRLMKRLLLYVRCCVRWSLG